VTEPTPPKAAPKLAAQDWDVLVAAALDSADRAEQDARAAGSPRLAAASIRHLRHLAHQLAAAGTPNALASPPESENVPSFVPRPVEAAS
jgi:hypothetical protein